MKNSALTGSSQDSSSYLLTDHRSRWHTQTEEWQTKVETSHCRHSSQTTGRCTVPPVREMSCVWSAEAKTNGEKRALILRFVLTSVTMERPRKKQTTQMARRRSLRRWPTWKKAGYMSEIAVVRASRPTNWNTVLQKNVNVFSKILKVQKDMWSVLVMWHDVNDHVTWCLSLSRTGHTHSPNNF